ncbi:hypothetical protein LTR62_003496 [Meristemomyces frigidus]|uniref:Uncharacterized protein n=1 Tax=Meristemomyces frigidus TaxID=1508187 RepID=A0AAN7YPP6_9PEZI|nr:hypothetical protein LTR62_003496 [Meristemomyces frigidus]
MTQQKKVALQLLHRLEALLKHLAHRKRIRKARSKNSFLSLSPTAAMTPTLHLVRHAQGFHNLNVANHIIHDPVLTPLGEEQCRTLAANFPYHDRVEAVVASPMKRTIATALLGFSQDLQRTGTKLICLPEVQETSDLPCDTGSSVEELREFFAGKPVDFSLVAPDWNSKKGKFAAKERAIEARAREARRWLMRRLEKEVVVCGYLHYFTEDWADSNRFNGTGWANTEYRSYTFSSFEPEEAHLVETEESKARRSGSGKALDREERAQVLPEGVPKL